MALLITDKVLTNCLLRLPNAVPDAIWQTVFDIVDDLKRNWLQLEPPSGTNPDLWLSNTEWQDHYRLIVDGTVARMAAELSRPYTNEKIATVHMALYSAALLSVRANVVRDDIVFVERVLSTIRVRVPLVRDAELRQQMFETVYELRKDVLDLGEPTPPGQPELWLTQAQWAEFFRFVIEGTVARLKSQSGLPWFDEGGATIAGTRYAALMARARADSTTPSSISFFARLLENVRLRVPTAREAFIERNLYDVVFTLTQDALQVPTPDPAAQPMAWLTDAQWREHYKLLVEGTVSKLMPADAGAAASFAAMMQRVRANAASGVAPSAFDRVMQNIRVHVGPAARDGVIQMELYNTVDEVFREALYRDPPAQTQDPRTWMSDADWSRYLRLLVSGTLMRLHAQTQPYADAGQVSIHGQQYAREMVTARTDATGGPNASLFTQLFDTVRLQCQGIKDSTISLEYFNACLEFCERSTAWRRTILIPLAPDVVRYRVVAPAGAAIRDIVEIGHPTLETGLNGWFYDKVRGEILFHDGLPRGLDLGFPLLVRLVLQPDLQPGLIGAPTPGSETLLPADILREHYGPILDGVLMRLFKLPSRPWTNAALAAYHGRRWSNHTGLSRARVRDQVAGTSRLRFPIFARG